MQAVQRQPTRDNKCPDSYFISYKYRPFNRNHNTNYT